MISTNLHGYSWCVVVCEVRLTIFGKKRSLATISKIFLYLEKIIEFDILIILRVQQWTGTKHKPHWTVGAMEANLAVSHNQTTLETHVMQR